MKKPMRRYTIEKSKVEQHSFLPLRNKSLAYAEYGNIKSYANITQAQNKVAKLKEIGIETYVRGTYPFYLIKAEVAEPVKAEING